MKADDLGNRMKVYERSYKTIITPKLPIIIRVDGKAFHTLTKSFSRPFDYRIENAMSNVALALCSEIDGAVFAYRQSDEVSVLIRNDQSYTTEAWFSNSVQKMVSVAASIAAVTCSQTLEKTAYFDARVFSLPPSEVVNYFIWRQQDASRNSIQMLARSLYSHKECHKKNTAQLNELCYTKGSNWNDLPTHRKRGSSVYRESFEATVPEGPKKGEVCERSKFVEDRETPVFTQDRGYVERWLIQTSCSRE